MGLGFLPPGLDSCASAGVQGHGNRAAQAVVRTAASEHSSVQTNRWQPGGGTTTFFFLFFGIPLFAPSSVLILDLLLFHKRGGWRRVTVEARKRQVGL